jgi:hypothetical protein
MSLVYRVAGFEVESPRAQPAMVITATNARTGTFTSVGWARAEIASDRNVNGIAVDIQGCFTECLRADYVVGRQHIAPPREPHAIPG